MAESKGLLRGLLDDPATKGLLDNVGKFGAAKVSDMATRAATGKSGSEGAKLGAVSEVADKKAEGGKAGPLTAITGALKGFFGKGGGSKRPTNIYEQNFIGVPQSVAYREWKQYSEFPKYMKGPESVSEEQQDGSTDEADTESSVGSKTKWTAKIFVNRRSWTATVEEDIEDYKIRWTSEAPKGTVDGTVTFHWIDDNLTLMVYVLEYRPKGFFERIGNLNRVVGRRARLDAKHFARYVMMQPAEDDDTEEDIETDDEENDERDDERDEPGEEAEGGEEGGEPGDDRDDATEPDEPDQRAEPDEPEQRQRGPRTPREPRRPRATR